MQWIRVMVIRAASDVAVRVGEIPAEVQAMQAVVGGCIERVAIAQGPDLCGIDMWVSEDGLLLALPRNERASKLAGKRIVGDCFLARRDAKGETIGLTDADVSILTTALNITGGIIR